MSNLARCCLPLVVVLRSLLASFFLVVVFGTAVTMSQGIAPDFREPGTAMMTLFQISVGCLGGIRAYPLAISHSMKTHEVLMVFIHVIATVDGNLQLANFWDQRTILSRLMSYDKETS